jgi:hypothetical protein
MLKFKEFLLHDGRVVVHCDTQQKANNLLAWAHSKGKTWCNHETYLNNTCWDKFREWTCYDIANGRLWDKVSASTDTFQPKCVLTYEEVGLYE